MKKPFRSPSDFINGALTPPEADQINPPLTAQDDAQPASATIAEKQVQTPPEAEKPATGPENAPWADGNAKVKIPFAMRLDEPLHLKLKWLSENVPKASMHSIITAGAEKEVDLLLAKYYR